ncbi:MAG: hypothetical protein AB7I27_12110 [Bacteriovoracaceae bacterium]
MKILMGMFLLALATESFAADFKCSAMIKDYTNKPGVTLYSGSISLDLTKRQDTKILLAKYNEQDVVFEISSVSRTESSLVVNLYDGLNSQKKTSLDGLLGTLTSSIIGDASATIDIKLAGSKRVFAEVICYQE